MINNAIATKKLPYIFISGFFLFLFLISNRFGFITLLMLWSIITLFFVSMRKYADKTGLLIIFFSLVYSICGILTGSMVTYVEVLPTALPMFSFYVFGKLVGSEYSNKQILLFLPIVLFAYSLEIFFTIVLEIIQTGSIFNSSREFYLLGDENRSLTATIVGLRADCGIIGIPLALSMFRYSKTYGFSYFLLGLLSFLTTIFLLNRTAIVIFIVISFLNIYYWNKRNIKKIILLLFLVVVAVFVLSESNIVNAELFQAYSERNDNWATGGDRTMRWTVALINIFRYPFGWNDDLGYVHNMWLDIAKASGIIPFLLLLLLTLISFKDLYKLIRTHNDIVSITLVSLSLAIFLSCMVEPIYGGIHLFLYAFVWGIVRSYIYKQNTFR